ncbi:MAG: hypothetical protein EPN79_15985 [Burkholderiaceae bacterium]|nr:MAG: hypothetical protein EPN79_15985 [Burkholderiaceae bacterium]
MDDSILVEVALRDMRNLEVIKALDRLVLLPSTKEQLRASLADLNTVQAFIQHLPDQIQHAARAMFIEHGRLIESHFRAQQGAPTSR